LYQYQTVRKAEIGIPGRIAAPDWDTLNKGNAKTEEWHRHPNFKMA
jgi:hypothetical protein